MTFQSFNDHLAKTRRKTNIVTNCAIRMHNFARAIANVFFSFSIFIIFSFFSFFFAAHRSMISAKLIQKAGGSFDLGSAQVHYERWVIFFFQGVICLSAVIRFKAKIFYRFLDKRLCTRDYDCCVVRMRRILDLRVKISSYSELKIYIFLCYLKLTFKTFIRNFKRSLFIVYISILSNRLFIF